MPFTIAVAGKGGTGKTTLTALIIYHLRRRKEGNLLVVDADPNVNLNELLGLEVEKTIGQTRQETLKRIKKADFPAGMSRSMFLEFALQECLVESEGLDLLVMGRGEGPGCYCFVNDILRHFLDSLTPNYHWVIMDNEAGMEHLSRETTRGIDVFLIVSDISPIAIRAAARISYLADKLQVTTKKKYLVLNNIDDDIPPLSRREIEKSGLSVAGQIPRDEIILSLSRNGRPLTDLGPDNPAAKATEELLKKLKI